MKILLVMVAVFMFQASQSCGTGPTPMKQAASLPDITCGKPYTAQLVTGGTPPYHFTISALDFDGAVLDDSTLLGLGLSQQGGGSKPLVIGQTIDSTGYLVGTVPCSILSSNGSITIEVAGAKLTVRNKS